MLEIKWTPKTASVPVSTGLAFYQYTAYFHVAINQYEYGQFHRRLLFEKKMTRKDDRDISIQNVMFKLKTKRFDGAQADIG